MAPPTAASKLSATPALLGRGSEIDAMARQQRLVGGDHRFAGLERGLDRRPRRIAGAAHEFDKHVDLAIGRKPHRIGHPAQPPQVDRALLGARAGRDRDDFDRPAAAGGQRSLLLGDHLHHGSPDRAEAGNT